MSTLTTLDRIAPRACRSRLAVIALSAILAGCAVGEGGMLEVANPPAPAADSALAALSRGDLEQAEAWAARALRENPRDPYALLIWGMLSERAGQPAVAREAYDTIVRLDPSVTIDLTPMDIDTAPRPIVDIAEERRDRLPPTPVGPGLARVPGVTGPSALATPDSTAPARSDEAWSNMAQRFETMERLYDEGLITNTEYAERRAQNLGALLPLTQAPPAAGLNRAAPRPTAVVGRLQDLAETLETGAISPRQHAEEREAILDALLPAEPQLRADATAQPSSTGEAARMGRRLETALRHGLVTGEEYDAERAALRDLAAPMAGGDTAALRRIVPAARPEPPTAPAPTGTASQPADGAEAGMTGSAPPASGDAPGASRSPGPSSDAPRPLLPVEPRVGPFEPGATAGPPTANREDPATQRFSGVTGSATGSDAAAAATRPVAPGDYVHLASYRDMESARAGWTALSRRYAGLMRDMSPHFESITLPGKGTFIRLKAGPVAIPGGPVRLCDQLQATGQFCEPTPLEP
ncbi:hypothetical protein F1188_04285 [Roseospira marina]|uniref:Uncharacterized protein n=1 Tax=Roseospira marina TaxID=140057 RepID=A0A5M6IFQ6_9PROT|nr:hypothetical protein [Roseospira marina]KAA5607126.1 hypothetical protein F1188_04285 [Roseospira marina]MBB4312675.1 hypothetical protein [Roseospira marina]MBB5086552.1 hypothetical protein [Roseospira marina]